MRSTSADARVAALLPLPPRDYLILLALLDGPLHGHGLLRAMERGAGGVVFDPANLYRLLRKLEREALVGEVRAAATADRSRRREYTLTPLGRAVLAAETARLTALTDAVRARKLATGRAGTR